MITCPYGPKYWSTPELQDIWRTEFAAYFVPRTRDLIPVKNRWGGLAPVHFEIHVREGGRPVLVDLLLDFGGGARWWRCCFEARRSGTYILLTLLDRHLVGSE